MWVDDDARQAATLVALGFAGEKGRYREARPAALDRWRADAGFRRLAGAIAQGMGLALIDVTPEGEVVLVAAEETPFTPSVETLLPGNVASDEGRRQLAVLALLGVVAEVFPTEDALAGADEAQEVTPSGIVQLLLSRAEAASREPIETSASAGASEAAAAREEDLRRAFEVVRSVQPSVTTKSGREGALGLEGTVTHVLRKLAEHGLLREVPGDRPGFRPTAALAPHVRHLLDREALDGALVGLREARAALKARS